MTNLPFDRESRSALAAAINAARDWRHPAVGPGHILAGILRHSPKALPDVDPRDAEKRIRSVLQSPSAGSTGIAAIPYDAHAKEILVSAVRIASESSQKSVQIADLIQALRMAGDTVTTRVLGSDGRTAVEAARTTDLEDVTWLRVSDDSDVPYHQQIADQIRDAIASGRLIPGQRLPTVRGLAQTLDLAPGTVAKAYRALDAEGVIDTAGSRGTLVATPKDTEGDPNQRVEALVDLLRPVAVAAFHMGSSQDEFSRAVNIAISGVLGSHRDDAD